MSIWSEKLARSLALIINHNKASAFFVHKDGRLKLALPTVTRVARQRMPAAWLPSGTKVWHTSDAVWCLSLKRER